ncbi:AAA family ATPase [Treponema sp. OMZ 840]|uniref:AAA family ATPase n=1 Tax=Treponema sp. OMZ 840 TaxID=244313 RepID=UPI003D906DC9
MDLFAAAAAGQTERESPLAARMRPRNLDEYIGQDHIVGKGRLLRRAIAADRLSSVIFYGPPGTGKTTLARVIAHHTKSNFVSLNAVLSGVQQIRDAIAQADEQRSLYNRRTILFVDEVHRWNKSQQDALLPWVENGTIILVGATTENPFFEVNKALVSRSRVFQLFTLTKDDLMKAARAALDDKERGYGRWKIEFEKGALEHLIDTANGDARSLLNALELAVETTPERWAPDKIPCEPPENSPIYISCETAEESIQKKVVLYDRDGDYHYDIISAFIKSLRGRDPDAAMYWMARMLAAGEDPHFIFRRMLISACEDTGLADPHAIGIVESCAAAFDRIGLPEGRFMLTQAALYLATCPKSNSTLCFFDALKSVGEEDAEVPDHLKDPSRDAEALGHGKGYMYPHAYKDHWTAQQYLPDGLAGRVFYNPSGQGYEKIIRDEVLSRRELQIAAMLEESQQNTDRLFWQHRTESDKTNTLRSVRDTLINAAHLKPNSRCLVVGADDALLLWEINRKTPDGLTVGLCRSEKGMQILSQYTATLEDIHRPEIILLPEHGTRAESFAHILKHTVFSESLFDAVFYKNPVSCASDIDDLKKEIELLQPFLAKQSAIFIAQKIPSNAQRLSALLEPLCGSAKENAALIAQAAHTENAFYTDASNPLFSWDEQTLQKALETIGKKAETPLILKTDMHTFYEKRKISTDEINRWFNAETSAYGGFFSTHMQNAAAFYSLFAQACEKHIFDWQSSVAFFALTC